MSEAVDGAPNEAITQAERSVLGAMLLAEGAIRDVLELGLKPENFYDPKAQTIFAEICSVFMSGGSADPVTVSNGLLARGELARVGGAAALHALVAEVPTATNANYYAAIVRDAAIKRSLATAAARLAQAAASGAPAADVLTVGYSELDALSDTAGNRSTLLPVDDLFMPHLESIEARAARSDEEGVRPHLSDLHRMIGNLEPGQMIIIGGRPGSGKTTVGLDLARYNAIARGKKVAVFSMEMSKQELLARILAAHCSVDYEHVRSGRLTEADWAKNAQRANALREAPVWIDDSASLTPSDVKAKARQLQAAQGLDLVVVDYLQLMSSGVRHENRATEVAAMSRHMKLMAKELGVPVVVLSQLNRNSESREGGRPKMADLRESGGLEADADVILLVHREEMSVEESEHAGTALIIVGKQRAGSTGDVRVLFQGDKVRMVDMETRYEPGAAA